MALDFTGLINQQEFYPEHYLKAILEGDLKGVFARWDEASRNGANTPPDLLKAVFRSFRRSQEKFKKDPEAALEWWGSLWSALGYTLDPRVTELESGLPLTVQAEVRRSDGAPWLWILDASRDEEDDPLDAFEGLVTEIFGRSEPPRWVILADLEQIILLDRLKWNAMRNLRFQVGVVGDRQDSTTLRLMAALLHRDSLCPDEGSPLLDTLTDNAHKHAYGVSQELKYALRASIELLGNEAVWYLSKERKEKVYGTELADRLTIECLRYMYRLLFLFYIEARPELGYAPMNAPTYLKGYSLEHLRDLELVPLTTEEARNGTYFHQSLSILFRCIFEGFDTKQANLYGSVQPFRLVPLKAHLFDPELTPTLNKVQFRNHVLQKVIELMSLSPRRGFRDRRGRISYAQLGINQLGAVYEALLSFKGWFAEDDLYEVKKAEKVSRAKVSEDEEGDDEELDEGDDAEEVATARGADSADSDYRDSRLLEQAFFVKAADLPKYRPEEKVLNPDKSLKKYPKGTFIYRLSGRAREKSASYYTPEVLTQCLVKYALKVLLEGKTADEILSLTVCEPAMGSAAFLNEAVNQLAEAYLERKEQELGRRVPAERRMAELQKVKMYLADNNVFGVDLNPVAVELAEVSLWLNTIVGADEGAFVPWFGMQLTCGNSLIGARRDVFDETLLKYKRRTDPSWLNSVPERVMPGEKRPGSGIYHWLLPDEGMASYDDKVIKAMAPAEIKELNERRKEFIKPFSDADIAQLQALSAQADVLWARHAATQAEVRRRTIDPIPVWGQPERPQPEPLSTREKDALFDREIRSKNEQLSSAYARLKLAMDYWCALWFWPIDQAHLFPSRDEYLMEVSYILKGEQYVSVPADVVQLKLLGGDQMALKEAEDNVGAVNIAEMCHRLPRLQLVQELASLHQFLHWELEFADQFANNGGFDLVVGNPPWIKVEWEEGGVLGDTEPLFVFRDFSAANLSAVRNAAIERNHGLRPHYLEEYRNACSTQAFLTGQHNYPNLTGTKANLYKCFILKAWVINNCEGVAAFIHPEGVYDDPNGGPLRAELFDRIRYHFQFQNELPLFPEIGNRIRFSINVYGPRQGAEFLSISNLFSPTTADDSLDSYCCGPVGGIKTEDGKNWNLKGHPFRVIEIGTDELRLFASMYGNSAAPEKGAALPVLHSRQLLDVLRKISSAQLRLGTTTERHLLTQLWNETIAQHNGTIQRQTQFPSEIGNSVISGPHFYVCNPLYKTPRRVCNTHRAYDNVDLCHIPSDWIPRSNYIPLGDRVEYLHRSPSVNWGDQDSVINYYRLCCRRQLGLDGERTLIPALIPAHAAHIDSVLGLCTDNPGFLAGVLGMWSSVPLDFFVKISGRSDIRTDLASKLPIPSQGSPWFFELIARTLALNCVSAHYSAFWDTVWDSRIATARWTRPDKRLDQDFFAMLTKNWAPSLSIRADYARRQALVEIDVLVSLELGLTLDELQTIYRIQFPVLQQNEKDTWYDRNGRIVFTCSKGLPGVGFSRAEWNKIKDMMSGQVHRTILDDTLPGGPRERTITYEAPFDRCDRELDYAIAWAAFESRFAADRIGVGGRPC